MDFLFNLYENDMRKIGIVYRARRFFLRRLINVIDLAICYYRYYISPQNVDFSPDEADYFISFTSFPGRIHNTWRVVENMFGQMTSENRVSLNLFLSKQQFSNGLSDLPKKLINQTNRGLHIYFMDDDLRAHKKYYYAFQKWPNKCIITIDDDIIYQRTLIKELIDAHVLFPNLIISQRARLIIEGQSYATWPLIYEKNIKLFNVLTTNGGGTLFPPNCYSCNIFNKDIFKEICFFADDLWISFMCRLHNKTIYYIGNNVECVDILQSQKVALRQINNNKEQNINDVQINNLSKWGMEKFSVDFYLN